MTTVQPEQSTSCGKASGDTRGEALEAVRAQFPALSRTVNGHRLVYLDSSATTQKPQCVIDAIVGFYSRYSSNVHRGVHRLSQEATQAFEGARDRISRYLGASDSREIIFTRGATEALNLVANTWGRTHLRPGDEILLSNMEHHSDIVPWQLIAEQTGAVIRVIPVNENGELDLNAYRELLNDKTRIVGCVHVSNALGTINPVKEMTSLAHDHGAVMLIDGAQALPHMQVNVRNIGCDFYAASAHKSFGPTGIGCLYGRFDLLDSLPPWHGGGDMIKSVSFEKTTYNDLPNRFEAGTPNIAGAIGFGAAIAFLDSLDGDVVSEHEADLLAYGTQRLEEIDGLRVIGKAGNKASVISFVIDGIHPHDIGTLVDQYGVAIRTGHHCTQPLMDRLGVTATARASMAMYNTHEDLDLLVDALHKVIEVFR